jgi:signal transduction histidine kinase
VSLFAVLFEKIVPSRSWHLPLFCDLVALGYFMIVSPTMVPAWFPYLFVCYVAGIRWGLNSAFPLAGLLSLELVLLTVVKGEIHWIRIVSWVGLAGATFAAGAGIAFLGDRNRLFAVQNEFFSRITSTMEVDQGLAECLRLFLDELTRAFQAQEALLVYRDIDLERIFLWRHKAGEGDRLMPDNLPLTRADGLLLDDADASICWNSLVGAGSGFGWDRRDRHIGPSLENVFLLRHLRARAIEAERSRISRDLHDGILQTLLSFEIQLDVLRRQVGVTPEQASASLALLQQTVKGESAELRRMVTDMRPVRVQSADLVDLMIGFAERFRNESTLALDLLIDSVEVQAPDRVCRELFQIYREALNNIKKHAKASHVVVKLSQDDSRLVLVVDDNGEGFSFAGRFTGDELDRLRLGPISIKERTRTVGGVLTVESNPGHGARLSIEIPLG